MTPAAASAGLQGIDTQAAATQQAEPRRKALPGALPRLPVAPSLQLDLPSRGPYNAIFNSFDELLSVASPLNRPAPLNTTTVARQQRCLSCSIICATCHPANLACPCMLAVIDQFTASAKQLYTTSVAATLLQLVLGQSDDGGAYIPQPPSGGPILCGVLEAPPSPFSTQLV